MSKYFGQICVISDAPSSIMKTVCQKMHLQLSKYNYDNESVVAACAAHWDLLIIESIYNFEDAIGFCENVRAAKPFSQIFVVSRSCSDSEISDFLLHGADDHICAPFSEAVFQAKISSALRRSFVFQCMSKRNNSVSAIETFSLYPNMRSESSCMANSNTEVHELIQILPESKKAIVEGIHISLTKTELSILAYFTNKINIPCEKFEILQNVLGYKDDCYLTSLYSHINRLRRKLIKEKLTSIKIKTIWRYGYKMVIERKPSSPQKGATIDSSRPLQYATGPSKTVTLE